MKKILNSIIIAMLLITLALSACSSNPSGGDNSSTGSDISSESMDDSSSQSDSSSDSDSSSEKEGVVINTTLDSKTIKLSEVESFNYTSLFEIVENGKKVQVAKKYIDLSLLKAEIGTYQITCNYKGVSASINIEVVDTIYEIILQKEEISVKIGYVEEYDYLALFSLTGDGIAMEITQDMITNNVKAVAGDYNYIVSYKGVSKTLVVHVIDEHDIDLICSYNNYQLAIGNIETFDYTMLFSAYVDKKAWKITADMIDNSPLNGAVVGDEKDVTLTFTAYGTTKTSVAKVTIIDNAKTIINGRNVETYPNDEHIDLTTLFTITKEGENIPVTLDMITGSIDYTKEGINKITLTYDNITAVAEVKVVVGVVIGYTKSDTIIIKNGTNKEVYPFEDDFDVVINGIKFNHIADMIDSSAVDFSKNGRYTAKITIKYNEKDLGLSVKFDTYEKQITYVVVNNEYKMNLREELVTLPKGTTKYYPYNNINLYINDIRQSFTTNKDWVNAMTCYVELVSKPIDFSAFAKQKVVIDVFVNGPENEPQRVSYDLIIKSDVKIEAHDSVVFTNNTVFTTDLFKITDKGNPVEVTQDMVSGKVDTFVPGSYEVQLNYNNIIKTVKVIVVNEDIIGTYKTTLTTFDSRGEVYEDEEGYAPDEFVPEILGDLVIYKNNGILAVKQGKSEAKVVGVVNENTFIIEKGIYKFNLTIDNGIAILNPVNVNNMRYGNDNRPMTFFAENKWNVKKGITINSVKDHVLWAGYTCYSIDTFILNDVNDNSELLFGMKVDLVQKRDTDWMYENQWGEISFKDGKIPEKAGIFSYVDLNGERYNFKVTGINIARIQKEELVNPFGEMLYRGKINGVNATLLSKENLFQLTIDQKNIFTALMVNIASMSNGGIDAENNTLMVYEGDIRNNVFYSYKFILNKENATFEYVKPDELVGLYMLNNQYVFIDGYGSGFINFNTDWYYTTDFEYTKSGNIINIKYKNTKPSFEYGKGGSFFVDEFLNVLTARGFTGGIKEGSSFVNQYISDGAIVKIDSLVIGKKETSTETKKEFINGIHITTKDGEMGYEQKTDGTTLMLKRIHFGKAGFYQFIIKVKVNGSLIEKKYAVQILEPVLRGNAIVRSFEKGVFYNNKFSIDEYGRVTLVAGSDVYRGSVIIRGENAFTSTLHDENGHTSIASGSIVQNGTLFVKFEGDIAFSEYYTINENGISGSGAFILRYFKDINDNYMFILSSSLNDTGRVVNITALTGSINAINSILKVSDESGFEQIVKIINWKDAKNGLVLQDGLRGEYTLSNNENLKLDGFGEAGYGLIGGSYLVSYGDKIHLVINGENKAVQINKTDKTYSIIDLAFDNSLVSGKKFKARYSFFCKDSENVPYNAETTFEFKENGVCYVASWSFDHDNMENGCKGPKYNPPFASKDGVKGEYNVTGRTLTVTVNEYTLIFTINDVFTANEITCESTTIPVNEHGYFAKGTIFGL